MSRNKLILYAIGAIFILVFLIISLRSCGSSKHASTLQPIAQGSKKQCGNITLTLGGTMLNIVNAQHVEKCFWQAYQQCHSASLVLTAYTIDGLTTRTFSTENQKNGCIVSDAQQVSIPSKNLVSHYTNKCDRVLNITSGLRVITGADLRFVNCGNDGTIDIAGS